MNTDSLLWMCQWRWMVGAAICILLLTAPRPADAKVLVLSFQGPDAAKIQAAIAAALASTGHDVSPGDTSYEDAAVMIGCEPSSDACADSVLDTLAVDEAVFGTSAKNGDIVIQLAALGQPRRRTRCKVEPGQHLDDALAAALRTLFDEPVEPAAPPPVAAAEVSLEPSEVEAPPSPLPPMVASPGPVDHPYRRWSLITWSGSGVAVMAGLVLWIRAGSLQSDIDKAPADTSSEIAALRDLEDQASTASTWGNALVVVGAGLAGVGTYFWVKDHRQRRASMAAIRPMLLPGGAGVMVTIGGAP